MQEVGRYQIDEMSGEGAMARVYKAYDPKIDRTLAIKALKSHLLADDEYRARFLREAKGAGILSHPNIVTVFDVGEEDRQPYIAMEWVDGPTLADLLKGGKTFTPRQIVEIGIQLARALDYAHKKGIIHRDVKPGNIMLVHDTLTVKVADFGICRINETEQTQRADQTQVGAVLGTPNYMSPEQVQGLPVDARSDLFSAGVVLYQMLTGHLPFEGDSMISVVYKIANTDAPTLDALRPDLPLSLRRVIAGAEESARKTLSIGRSVRAGADRHRPRNRRGRAAQGQGTGDPARHPMGARDGRARGGDDVAHCDGPLSASIRGDARPGHRIWRVAHEAGRRADRRTAARRGLGGDRRVHPGDAEPAGVPVPAGHRSSRGHPRQQRCRAGGHAIQAAAGDADACARSGRDGAELPAARQPRGARLRHAGPLLNRKRSAEFTSGSSRRRSRRSRT
jgi:tRNA A-37 threonylcarbamoyl transferase component Bud32